jgi:hypothetical protein
MKMLSRYSMNKSLQIAVLSTYASHLPDLYEGLRIMGKHSISFIGGTGVILLCCLDFWTRMEGNGHVVFSILDRPFSFVLLLCLLGIAIWSHMTKREIIRNIALSGCVFVLL